MMFWLVFTGACFLPYLMIWALAYWGGIAVILAVLALWVIVETVYGE